MGLFNFNKGPQETKIESVAKEESQELQELTKKRDEVQENMDFFHKDLLNGSKTVDTNGQELLDLQNEWIKITDQIKKEGKDATSKEKELEFLRKKLPELEKQMNDFHAALGGTAENGVKKTINENGGELENLQQEWIKVSNNIKSIEMGMDVSFNPNKKDITDAKNPQIGNEENDHQMAA